MVKKISIVAIILAVIFGGVGMYIKTKTIFQPEKSFETINQTVAPTSTGAASQTNSVPIVSPSKAEKGPSLMEIDTKKTYEAVLKTTLGDITIQLNASGTPISVNNFIALSWKKYYDNTIFHRIIKGFMIQGGDPKGNGTGGPGYTFADEPFQGEYTRGTVAMANAGPNTNGSQFFIMHKDYPLPKNYVIFGKVTKGIEVVDTIAEAPTQTGGEGSTPVSPTTITSVQIIEE
jgi:cyclophilin family peptidyl-prolyl cis-trans isomerase